MADYHKFIRNALAAYADAKGFELSDKADKVIDLVVLKDGFCPCRAVPVPCPCPFHEEEIATDGQCHCNLFRKKP